MTDITKEMLEALKPFARVAEIFNDAPPTGSADILHSWETMRGSVEITMTACANARRVLSAALSRPIDPKAEVEALVKPSIDTMREAAWEVLRKNGWEATARLSLHQVSGLMAQFGMNVSAGEVGCGYPDCGCCDDAACEDAIKQHPDFAPALTPAEKAGVGDGDGDGGAWFEAVAEQGNDNFATSIYEADYKGLLIARCNQNGAYPHHVTAILNGLNGKQVSAELIAKQAAEIEALRALSTTKPEKPGVVDGERSAKSMTDDEISTELFQLGQIVAEGFGEGSGSPGEWYYERRDELSEEQDRRAALSAQGDDAQEGTE